MQEHETELHESFTVKHGDLSITVSSNPDGVLANKSEDEIFKYCADVLLGLTDTESLENKIEIPIAIQETLEKDFGWDRNKTFEFVRRLKKRLYMMNIGEFETKEERTSLVRKQQEERAKERFKESTGIDPDARDSGNQISVESGVVTVLPGKQNFSKEDMDTPVSFSVSGDAASATIPKPRPQASKAPRKQPQSTEREQ